MKPFEEQYTAWIDGVLDESERIEFEARLEKEFPGGLREAQIERKALGQLGGLLRQQAATAPALKNAEFFNQHILRQIEAATAPRVAPASVRPLPLGRLIWGGLASLGIAALLFAALVFPTLDRVGPPPEYYAQILNAKTGDSALSAVAIHSNQENVTVLWIDGLEYLPAKAKN